MCFKRLIKWSVQRDLDMSDEEMKGMSDNIINDATLGIAKLDLIEKHIKEREDLAPGNAEYEAMTLLVNKYCDDISSMRYDFKAEMDSVRLSRGGPVGPDTFKSIEKCRRRLQKDISLAKK